MPICSSYCSMLTCVCTSEVRSKNGAVMTDRQTLLMYASILDVRKFMHTYPNMHTHTA